MAATAVELLESRRLAAAAQERAGLLTAAEELAGVGHFRVDFVSNRTTWSEQVYAIYGRDPELPPPPLEHAVDAYHPEDRAAVAAHVEGVRRGQPFAFEARLLRGDGEERLVRAVGRPQREGETGKVRGLFGVFRDITDERLVQERLVQTQKMASVGTLAAGIAHEINNPLSYIKTNAADLRERLSQPSAGALPLHHDLGELAAEIEDGAARIEKIVGGLRGFSHPVERRLEAVDLTSALARAARLCMNALRHRARFEMDVGVDVPPVRADESELVQVAVNLIVNAAQAVEGGSALDDLIRVHAGVSGERVYFEVQDTGPGMTPDVLREALTPFFTTKPRGVGTGLGLAICHGIVTSFGGELELTSEPGRGTRARVWLAIAAGERPARPATSSAPPGRPTARRGRVLVVDDDPAVGRSIARLLREHEVEVLSEPLEAAARVARGDRWDVIVCDLMMPTLSGPALHARAVDADPALADRMVFVTGGAFTEEGRSFLARSGRPVVEKPIDGEALRDVVRRELGRGADQDPSPASS